MNYMDNMFEGKHKAKSGLIRALVSVSDGKVEDIIISGDFILTPERYIGEMEKALLGVCANKEDLTSALEDFFEEYSFHSPQTHPSDFCQAIVNALGGRD